jgi:putative cardiolipin synthase
MRIARFVALLALSLGAWAQSPEKPASPMAAIDAQIASHPRQTGVHVLETGREGLIARAWLADNAQSSIEAQYFIWGTDNIGILAAEALLRAADRGVKVRVIVDDLPIKAPDKPLLALTLHPNVDIKVYNPRSSVGTPLPKRVMNLLVDFRGFNQRMHNKVFIVDAKVAITGGRNMAAEYFDYNQEYNFRDRDAVVLGDAVADMRASFEKYWSSPLCVAVEDRFDGLGLLKKNVHVDDAEIQQVYRRLHEYANSPERFAPEVRDAIRAVPESFEKVAASIAWGRAEFVADLPGKNERRLTLGGGGATPRALAELVRGARERIVIQTPYLVLSDEALVLMSQARARGVRIRIVTNSLAATDNVMAFSGYRKQRGELLAAGLEIYEIRPDAAVMRELMRQMAPAAGKAPIFAIHAKTMVVDGKVTFIGTYNFDLRSQNLNTEAGVIVHSEAIAGAVERAILTDILPANSWNAATDNPDRHASTARRAKVQALQAAPIKPLL